MEDLEGSLCIVFMALGLLKIAAFNVIGYYFLLGIHTYMKSAIITSILELPYKELLNIFLDFEKHL